MISQLTDVLQVLPLLLHILVSNASRVNILKRKFSKLLKKDIFFLNFYTVAFRLITKKAFGNTLRNEYNNNKQCSNKNQSFVSNVLVIMFKLGICKKPRTKLNLVIGFMNILI